MRDRITLQQEIQTPVRHIRETRDYVLASSLWALGFLEAEHVPGIMADALEDGEEAESVVHVAGLVGPSRFEHGDRIRQAFADILGYLPTTQGAWDHYANYLSIYLLRLSDGDLKAGLELISDLWGQWHEAPRYFSNLMGLAEYDGIGGPSMNKDVRCLANEWLESRGRSL